MKISKHEFNQEWYALWELGSLIPLQENANLYSVQFSKNSFVEFSQISIRAFSSKDALERACFFITYDTPFRPEDIELHALYDESDNLLWMDDSFKGTFQILSSKSFNKIQRREFLSKFGTTAVALSYALYPRKAFGIIAFGFFRKPKPTIKAIGGVVTFISGYTVHTFNSSDTFEVIAPNLTIEYLVVAGGGMGAMAGGGGGGVLQGTFANLNVASLPITVGAGATTPGNGSDSSIGGQVNVTAIGGGGVANVDTMGIGLAQAGGSGAGGGGAGAHGGEVAGGLGTAGQGNAGGTAISGAKSGDRVGGGGGGAGGPGTNASKNGSTVVIGNGGNGISSDINGTPTYYGGGWGGGCFHDDSGSGANADEFYPRGSDGLGSGSIPNRGGGGGGWTADINGVNTVINLWSTAGSGVVIIRYAS